MPKVSVIIPNYNHAKYLKQRIDSVLNQTFQDTEVIILDDCSTDNSREIIETYALVDKRITTHRNQQNSGSTFFQWNKGVSIAKGEYIWIAESDDWAELNLLETLVTLLDKNSKTGIAYCQSNEVDEISGSTKKSFENDTSWNSSRMLDDFYNDGKKECSDYMLFRNTIPNASAVVFRKDVYLKAGNAPTHMKLCGDWMQWSKILMISDVTYCSKPLNYFRQHKNTVRSSSEKAGMYIGERYEVIGLIKNIPALNTSLLNRSLNDLMKKWMFGTKMKNIYGIFTKLGTFKRIDENIYGRYFSMLFLRSANIFKR